MLTDVGQVETKVWIRKMMMVIPSSPFFAKPNVIGCLFRVSVKTQIYGIR